MTHEDLLNAAIDDGIEEVREAYGRPDQRDKREGAIKGFEECRGKTPEELLALLDETRADCELKRRAKATDFWFWRYRSLQVEWVLNVVNAARHAHGQPVNAPVTVRGMLKANAILGGVNPPRFLGP